MVKHIIIWDFKDELTQAQRAQAAKKIKEELEGLFGVVEGLQKITVYTQMLPTSNGDLMLECELESASALEGYASHPEHIKVKKFIETVVKSRKCVDFLIS